jgi:hypothetical protein
MVKMLDSGYYKLNGRIPWLDIADNPSNHLKKQSCPDSDHKLEEPSHMKSDAVDAWIGHWLKIQKKNKRPLVLKDVSDRTSDKQANPTVISRRKGKKGKGRYVESGDSDHEVVANDEGVDEDHDGGSNEDAHGAPPDVADKSNEGATTATVLPPSPKSAGTNRKSRRTFLASLSDDKNYKKLQLLLYATKVCNKISAFALSQPLPEWCTVQGNTASMGNVEVQR